MLLGVLSLVGRSSRWEENINQKFYVSLITSPLLHCENCQKLDCSSAGQTILQVNANGEKIAETVYIFGGC
ncbi:MAG: hypothetical protein ACM37W_17705 [Actinomycetota bacterium]